jgi:thiamine phosphate synthase YjbQ (UPF0047 family)
MDMVYAVGIEYEGVVALFSTHEKAEAYIAENDPDGSLDIYYIENMEIQ